MATSRTTSHTNSRAASTARTQILSELKEDHKRVKKAYRDFEKLDVEEDPEACKAIVDQVLEELTVHATLEEELLYPAARGAIEDDLLDEAEVEHGTVHALIDQLKGMGPEDAKYAAYFTVLCEYVLHHVKEEEGEMFPQLESASLDWESLSAEMAARREELMPSEAVAEGRDSEAAESEVQSNGRGAAARATAKSGTGQRATRRA